jgi:uncharacterized hydrophobic protein (TIGR00271 family)
MGWLQRSIEAGREFRYGLPEIGDTLFLDRGSTRAKTSQFWFQLVLASFIAAGGVIGNSTPAVIGAMIIAPLATPIYGLALAAVAGDHRALRSSLLLLVSGVAVNILIGVLIALATVQRLPLDVNPQVVGRTSPTLLDLAIAIAVGLAGSFALVRRDVANILAGVAIAISLVPVLGVVGITLGGGRPDLAWGAFMLFLTNAAAILVAGVAVFTAAGYRSAAKDADLRAGHRARILIAVLLVVLVAPLGYASLRTWRWEVWTSRAQVDTARWLEGSDWHLQNVTVTGGDIVIEVFGPDSPPPVAALRKELRRHIPPQVPIVVHGENGTSTDL